MGSGIRRLCDGHVSWLLRRKREIEGVGRAELVCVTGLLRMGGESLLLPVWRSVGSGFTGKSDLVRRVCPINLVDGLVTVLDYGKGN